MNANVSLPSASLYQSRFRKRSVAAACSWEEEEDEARRRRRRRRRQRNKGLSGRTDATDGGRARISRIPCNDGGGGAVQTVGNPLQMRKVSPEQPKIHQS